MEPIYEKRGYLDESFRLFHIKDTQPVRPDFHYHEFHKVVLFIKGSGQYTVEGKHYTPSPWDIILVPRGCVHRPDMEGEYERIVIYLSPEYLKNSSGDGCELDRCFNDALSSYNYLLRPTEQQKRITQDMVKKLEDAVSGGEYGDELNSKLLLMQLMIELGRGIFDRTGTMGGGPSYNEKTVSIIKYINDNLTGDVTIDSLAERFFISKYHMMRSFKEQTGYSIHSYISNKRLLLARELIASGENATNACYACGFHDYSAFSRAYKKQFNEPPARRH